jgi:Txe/YoeB family toxin of Txe-Axe toxin-antitoxin module
MEEQKISVKEQKEDSKERNIYERLMRKITSNPFRIGRPEYLPPNATDCGWNHGEKLYED